MAGVKHFFFGLLIISAITNVNSQTSLDLDCKKVLEDFIGGLEIFKFKEQLGKYLSENGFTSQTGEKFSLTFKKTPLPKNMTMDFQNANLALYGAQNLVYNFEKSNAIDSNDVMKYLQAAKDCIPEEMRCPQAAQKQIECDPNALYRSYDGTCNNLEDPLKGSTLTPYSRLLPSEYNDHIMEIRKDWKGNDLNSPRRIVDMTLTKERYTSPPPFYTPNMGWYIFGQLLTHDIGGKLNMHHGSKDSTGMNCCSPNFKNILPESQRHHNCNPFQIAPNDQFYRSTKYRCHNFIRSQSIQTNDCQISAAEQVNVVSHFIDLSVIYGQTEEQSNDLRSFVGGQLKIDKTNTLPRYESCNKTNCFYTGDYRAGQSPPLVVSHSLFVRLHNKIAKILHDANENWDDEKTFEEARRINIAILQHITYNEYLPALFSERVLFPADYNSTTDPSTINDFSTGAFRYLHVYTPKNFDYYNEGLQIVNSVQISKSLDNTRLVETNYDDIVRGLMYQPIHLSGYSDEVRNRLFGGFDVASADIQRGRDHGIPPYWQYREICGFRPIKKFIDLFPMISMENIYLLRNVYSSVKDIDLYVGGGFEEKDEGSFLGPTFKCISRIQFARFKYGDRYFYTHKNGPNTFTDEQLKEIKKITLVKLYCILTNVKKVPFRAFYTPSINNRLVLCSSVDNLQLSSFKE